MTSRIWLVASLLFGSGFSALVYQSVWLRELRLVFGASTTASAAVLAVFLGGLGFGGLFLGRRADRSPRPLAFYAKLEFAVAATAAATPALVALAGRLYVSLGGSPVLGSGLATAVRLVFSTAVLGTTTFLMGGTLPAASRAVGSEADLGRRAVAALYGMNTLGGVIGVLLPTFFMFERFGVHKTLWFAAIVNALVAFAAHRISRRLPDPSSRPAPDRAESKPAPLPGLPPLSFVLLAAAGAGFAFLVMELVWYRMLAPILGGTTYTFGLILAVVLLGIGGGGILYAVTGRKRPATLGGLALTCTAEACFLALPYALGDRIALLALKLQPFAAAGFGSRVLAWAAVTSIVVLPGAIVSGYQFPLLVALLGRGRTAIGRQIGLGYAWNTIGAIAGSVAGGFWLLQTLTAPVAWKAMVWLLLALGGAAALLARGLERSPRLLAVAGLVLALSIFFTTAEGPTAAWRHSPIGAGRARLEDPSANGCRKWINEARRTTLWEAEGRESSVALQSVLGLTFLINGKSDGSARFDAATQVMYGLVGAVLHPRPESALVIGLGTGSTAGWMAEVPSIRRVDVAELEPAVLEVAKACSPVNRDALSNPKLRLFLGDARELLLTTRSRYDLIASEPSNPFRAGIASLFTREFYEAVRSRLNKGGIFLQWVQAYEVDARTIRTIYATLGTIFDRVETWQTAPGDLLLVCSVDPIPLDAGAIRSRIAEEPFRSALAYAWRVDDLEGFLARFVANASYARSLSKAESVPINTDDHPVVEFGFARTVGHAGLFIIRDIRNAARSMGVHRPEGITGPIDWEAVEDHRIAASTLDEEPPPLEPWMSGDSRLRAEAEARYLEGDLPGTLRVWESREDRSAPRGFVETAMVAEVLADAGREEALPLIERIRAFEPAEADLLEAVLLRRRADPKAAASALVRAFERCRTDPWPWPPLLARALSNAEGLAREEPAAAAALFESVMEPFAVRLHDMKRQGTSMGIAKVLGPAHLVRAFEPLEPHFIWNQDILSARMELYRISGSPRAGRAQRDYAEYLKGIR